ncbi:MAG: outer membrane protein assembly factor BamA [Candidatus Omnitrophica bacterium]|nr:outer membrane protein assembly factor BamA [Candidatus Omnitrophota bacterium]
MNKRFIIRTMRKKFFAAFLCVLVSCICAHAQDDAAFTSTDENTVSTTGLEATSSSLAPDAGLPTEASGSNIVSRISVKGNKIVSDASIISKIKIRSGIGYSADIINEDIKNLYATGFFDAVDVAKEETAEGIVVTFNVKEKPVLKKIVIEGAKFIRVKKIEETIELKPGSFVDEYKLQEAASKVKDLYTKKGFSQATVKYDIKTDSEKNEAEVKFIIEEKRVVKVRAVTIEGNKGIRSKKIIRLMKTRKNWLLNWSSFNEDIFSDDIKRIEDFYKSQGFTDVKVEHEINIEPKGAYIVIKVEEGKRYYIGKIAIDGNKDLTVDEIRKAMTLKDGAVYSEQAVYEDSSNIREAYMNKGYIFSQIDPVSYLNPETQKIDVTYKIAENQVAYVERIDIRGNVKTKDKVIRRELRIYPEDKFDGKKVKKSKERLENLGYFEEIRFGTEPGSKADLVDMIVDVKEAKTGYLSFGGGYSSINEFMGFVELRQRNFDYKNFNTFTGAGQDLSLYASLGTLTSFYQLSFTNPYVLDSPYSFGFDAYKKGHKRDTGVGYGYEEDVTGGDLRLGRDFNDYIKGSAAYRIDKVSIRDVDTASTQELKDEEGKTTLSSGEFGLTFDTRDNVFNTLSGIYFPNSFQITGGPFGGSRDFFKYSTRFSLYVPMIKKSVTEIRLRAGFADTFSDTNKIPIYERFFAGGANTIRGYSERKVGPVDSKTDDPIGGEAMFVANLEYTYPLVDFFKVAVFYDTGNVWSRNEDFFSTDLLSSFGLGVRVKTPVGPVSVDYGWPLDNEPGKEGKKGKFHFNVSRQF